LSYVDGSGRHEYVVFAESARRAGITQYLDNRQVYGYLTLEDTSGATQAAAKLLGGSDIGANSVCDSNKPGALRKVWKSAKHS